MTTSTKRSATVTARTHLPSGILVIQAAAADNCQAPVLQQQLQEMQCKEEAAAKAAKRSLAAQEREQKMLVSLMYDLGMEMHRSLPPHVCFLFSCLVSRVVKHLRGKEMSGV